MLNCEEIRLYCLTKKAVSESLPFDETSLVFKVAGKIFLILDLEADPPKFNAKCEPNLAIELREKYNSVQPGYHMNKKHWNTLVCDVSLKREFILSMIDQSYELVFRALPVKERNKHLP